MGSIEEDIKIVKQLNQLLKFFRIHGWIPDISREINKNKTIEAIEHLLTDYTRQKQINEEHQKINGELREKVKELDTKNNELLKDLYSANCIIADLTDSIPTQKIKDKIEELEKISNNTYIEFLETNKTDADLHDKGLIIDGKIQALKELLQESEDK